MAAIPRSSFVVAGCGPLADKTCGKALKRCVKREVRCGRRVILNKGAIAGGLLTMDAVCICGCHVGNLRDYWHHHSCVGDESSSTRMDLCATSLTKKFLMHRAIADG
jgi:hypothetical protein